jgi:hypothetical protein
MKSRNVLGLLLLLPAGCLNAPANDNPLLVRTEPAQTCENPVLVSPGPHSTAAYAEVWERVLSVMLEYFEVPYENRYDGRMITSPKIAPGIERFWMRGSPDARERLLATLQTYRYRGFVRISNAEQGGYFVQVIVLRELKDDPRPSNATSGAIFQDTATVDRQFEVVDPITPVDDRWIPKGRAYSLEDEILKRIRRSHFE